MTFVEEQLVADLLTQQIDLLRLEAGVRMRVLFLLDRMEKELVAKLNAGPLSNYTKARTTQLLTETREVIAGYYSRIGEDMQLVGQTVAGAQTRGAQQAVASALTVDVVQAAPTTTILKKLVTNTLTFGATNASWWKQQALDTTFKFANAVRQGMVQGETNAQIVARVAGTVTSAGVMDVSRKNASALVHTAIQSVANSARRETFEKNTDVISGIRQVSTLDGRTTPICIAYSGAEWDVVTKKPIGRNKLPYNGGVPRHWICRSVEVPITKSFKELGLDIPELVLPPAMRASGQGPVPVTMTFNQFLRKKGVDFQNEVLGKGRADLWRRGVITLQQLLDFRGNPLTLSQLEAKYGR